MLLRRTFSAEPLRGAFPAFSLTAPPRIICRIAQHSYEELTMQSFNFDAGTIAGMVVLVLMKTTVLNRYAWPKKDWEQWVVATAAGLAVSVAVRVLFR